MPDDTPTHWTQFDRLYNLPDPRSYFRGVGTADYRMPGVVARLLDRLIPVLEARRSGDVIGPVNMIDFACGYGAVGLCLRGGMTMADLSAHYALDGDPVEDPAYFAARRSTSPLHRITGFDIADVALDYAKRVGGIDAGHAENVLADEVSDAVRMSVAVADLIYECGAIGDHTAGAVDALLGLAANGRRPWVLICPRPRVATAPIEVVLREHGYAMHVLAPKVRYRRPFSDAEGAEEVAEGVANGLAAEDCLIDGYFRVDVRLATPLDEALGPALDALSDFNPNAV